VHFYDRETYRMVREGISLAAGVRPEANVTASSTGGWGNAAFYTYRPVDAYDGCDYTRWTPSEEPTAEHPQWLRFDFTEPVVLDGIRVVPYGPVAPDSAPALELSPDGGAFTVAELSPDPGVPHRWSFARRRAAAARLVFARLPAPFEPSDRQPVPPPQSWAAGVREVRFFGPGLADGPLPRRAGLRPSRIWEYNVGADWPSVCIDARPVEHRASAWQCWERDTAGYLNYGGAQWAGVISPFDLPAVLGSEPPMIWQADGNGGPNIIWPSRHGPLASVRFARFRDGIDDHDYLVMVRERSPDHALLARIRQAGRAAYDSPEAILRNREALADALERIAAAAADPGGP
jgi:hypothetical protein